MTTRQRFVRVEWDDSWSPTGSWHTKDRFRDEGPSKCVSVGFLAHENKNGVAVAAHKDEGGHFSGLLFIPHSAITKRKFIKEPK